MALTKLQKEIMASIAKNRSETSYVASGLVFGIMEQLPQTLLQFDGPCSINPAAWEPPCNLLH
jgi:hypothetical protein